MSKALKPLFIPLKSSYYNAFLDGKKSEELRIYGPRWNEHTCLIGRKVVLSKGYGKKNRMTGRIGKFEKRHGTTFGDEHKAAIIDCYGTLDIWLSVISIDSVLLNIESVTA